MDFFRKKPDPAVARKELFDAVARDDHALIESLCKRYHALILQHFESWSTIPTELRKPPQLEWYAHGLMRIAQQMAHLGHPEMLEHLWPKRDNILDEWRGVLDHTERCMAERRYREAASTLQAFLPRVEGLRGSGVDQYLPLSLERLSGCLFHCGDLEAAREAGLKAIALCEAIRDERGAIICLCNLYELQRYAGDAQSAASTLEQVSTRLEAMGEHGRARVKRRQAEIVMGGEPLCRVVVSIDGEQLELGDIPSFDQSVRYSLGFVRNRLELGASTAEVTRGERAGAEGDHAGALTHFNRAAQIDPFNPWPHYQSGLSLQYLRRYADAVAAYDAAEERAPGFFHVRSDRWLAQRLLEGAVPHEVFAMLHYLQDAPDLPAKKLPLALKASERVPIAPLLLVCGDLLTKMDRGREAEPLYRRGLAVAEEPDVRTRLLVALGAVASDAVERNDLLVEAAETPRGNLVASAAARIALRHAVT